MKRKLPGFIYKSQSINYYGCSNKFDRISRVIEDLPFYIFDRFEPTNLFTWFAKGVILSLFVFIWSVPMVVIGLPFWVLSEIYESYEDMKRRNRSL